MQENWLWGFDQFIEDITTGGSMNKYDKNKAVLYLTAVHNDLVTYLANPHEFDPEFFEDIKEAVAESLRLLEKEEV
jgi:hypothetical protein